MSTVKVTEVLQISLIPKMLQKAFFKRLPFIVSHRLKSVGI